MISMLEFLKDTLANVGLLEALLEWDPNNVTQIKIKITVKRDSNQILKKLIQIQSKPVSRIKSETMSPINPETVIPIKSETMNLIKSETLSLIKSEMVSSTKLPMPMTAPA